MEALPVNTAQHSDEVFPDHEHIFEWSLPFSVFQSDKFQRYIVVPSFNHYPQQKGQWQSSNILILSMK